MQQIHCNLPNSQIPAAEWLAIENQMYPGESSTSGFLAAGEKLKEHFIETLILKIFNLEEEIIVKTNTSNKALRVYIN